MSNNEYREAQQQAREHGLKARQEARLENATYTAAEVKVLTEAALRLGREETREELDSLRAIWWFLNDDFVQGDPDDGGTDAHVPWKTLVDLWDLHDAVEAHYQEGGYPPKPGPDGPQGASEPRTDPGVDSDLPPEPQAVREPQEDA